MLRSYDCVVYAEPVPWHRVRASRPWPDGKPRFFTQKEDLKAQFQIRAAWMEEHGDVGVLEGPLRLIVTAFLPAPKAMSRKQRLRQPLPVKVPDYDNLAKQVADALQKYAFADDKQIVTAVIRKRYALDAEGQDTPPRWVITLEVIEDGEDDRDVVGIAVTREPDRHRRGARQGTGITTRPEQPGPGA